MRPSPRRRTWRAGPSARSRSSTRSWSRRQPSRCPAARPDRTAWSWPTIASTSTRPGQGAWEDRRQVASFLGLAPAEVLVTQVSTGGAFGGKEDLSVQGQAALLAVHTGRPGPAPTLPPREHAVPRQAPPDVAGLHRRLRRGGPPRGGAGPHRRATTAPTRASAARSWSAPRATPAGRTGSRTWTWRRRRSTPTTRRRARCAGSGRTRPRSRWRACWTCWPGRSASTAGRSAGATRSTSATGARPGSGWGRGSASARRCSPSGMPTRVRGTPASPAASRTWASATGCRSAAGRSCGPRPDGTLTLFHSWTEMGQGAHTVFRQLAAAELGIPAERIRVVVDTTRELDTGETTSSRATMLGGRAVQRACAALTAALDDRGVAGLADLAGREFAGEYLVDWTTKLEAAVEEPVTHFAYGWATQVVILDDEGRIERVVAAHDVGKALNPVLLQGAGRGRRPHGARHGADRGVPGRGRRARHRHPQVAGHHPGRRHAAGRDDPGGGPRAGGPAGREGDGRGGAGADGRRRGRCAPRLRRDPPDTPADERLAGGPGAAPAAGARGGRPGTPTTGGQP